MFLHMEDALARNLSIDYWQPAVECLGEVFSHPEGHDMAMDLAYARFGVAAETYFELHSDLIFGYVERCKP